MALNEAPPQGTTVLRGPAAAKKFALPTDHDELIGWLEKKRTQGRTSFPLSQMKLNLAYYLGFQWVTWDSRMRTYQRPAIDPNSPTAPVRIAANKIAGIVERVIAKLTKDAPVPETRPVSDNDNDVGAARVGTRILAHECDRMEWRTRLQKFMFLPAIYGYGYRHIWWDPDAGDHVGDDDDAKEGENAALFQGEVCMEDVPADQLIVEPSADTMEAATWCIRTSVITTEAAWEKWDVGLEGGAQRSLSSQIYSIGVSDPAKTNAEWVEIHQLWMKPCKAAPNGVVVTWSGQTIIENKKFPYDHGELPFVQCDLLPGIDRREGRTFVNDLIPLQTDYNDNLSRMATIRRQLVPKYIFAVGQVDPQRITNRVEPMAYMPGVASERPHLEMPNAQWAQQFNEGANRDDVDMGDRAGINEASKGQTAASAPAAGIMALQDADDTKLNISATQLAQFIANQGRQILLLCKQYWDEERVVRVWSDENEIEAYRYSGADIDERLDVHVSTESALPRSKAARVQLIMELQARMPGLLDPQTFMNMLDLPGTDLITKSLDIDTRKQLRENSQLLRGEEPQIKPYDNHVIHIKVINDFRKSIDYENLPIEDQARFDAHAAVHEMLVLKQMGVAVPNPNPMVDPTAQAQAAQATAGPGGGAPPPGSAPQNAVQPPPPHGPPMAPGTTRDLAGIGGAGNPGQIPGMPVDQQAAHMGR